MKRPMLLLLYALTVGSAALASEVQPEGKVLGAGVTPDSATPIQALLASPQTHAGETLRVDGVVTEVDTKSGGWIKVSNPGAGSGVLIEIDNGAFAFPLDCVGHRISVEGVLAAVARAPASAQTQPTEAAAEEGDDAGDEDEDEHDDGPHVCAAMSRGGLQYRIRATGAILH